MGIGPTPADERPVPAQDGLGRDQNGDPALSGHEPRQGRDKCPIGAAFELDDRRSAVRMVNKLSLYSCTPSSRAGVCARTMPSSTFHKGELAIQHALEVHWLEMSNIRVNLHEIRGFVTPDRLAGGYRGRMNSA
jgi:hypothetical protein